MTPPADPRETLRELVVLGERATPGEWRPEKWVNEDGTGGWAAIGPHHTGEDDDTDEPGSPSDELATLDADFIAAAANARPALAALGKMCVLEVEVVRVLIGCARSGFRAVMGDELAALAAAEAEVRRVEGIVNAPSTLWIQDAPDVGGAHLVVDCVLWERATEDQRDMMKWAASTCREAVVIWEGKPLARWDENAPLRP